MNALGNLNALNNNASGDNLPPTDDDKTAEKEPDLQYSPAKPQPQSGIKSHNFMADVIARHETISNRVRGKDGK